MQVHEALAGDSNDEDSVDNDRKGHREQLDYKTIVDLVEFHGNLHIEEFLGWLNEIETFFEYMNVVKEKWADLVLFKLKGEGTSICVVATNS